MSRPRLILLPPSSTQQNSDSIMPLAASKETRSWLQERGLGGYLQVIYRLSRRSRPHNSSPQGLGPPHQEDPTAGQIGYRIMASRKAKAGVTRETTATVATLEPPAPTNEALPTSSLKPSLSATVPKAHNDDPAHPKVATTEASTMTDSVQTTEASSPAERQLRPQTSHATTQTMPPPVKTTIKPSPKADRTLSLQTRHASTQTPQTLLVMEKYAQTDTLPQPQTTQNATHGLPSVTTEPNSSPKSRGPSVWNNDTTKRLASYGNKPRAEKPKSSK